jgi:hypothetical protein
MIQIYINDKELDLPVDIINQIGINYEVFTIGEFANKFNSFSGNLTFPNTDTNRRVFGFATDNLNAGIVNREYTGRIVNNAVEVFSGEVNFERYNNGFECRFFTTGQLLIQALQPLDMFDVLLGLPRADVVGAEQWFDHEYSQVNTGTFVGTNVDGGKNVRYPLLDLGYFNNTNSKIGYFDLRATFSLWTMCLAIAKKVNKTLTFNGGLPTRLFNTFITPKDWKYSDRIIEVNALKLGTTGVTQSYTGITPVDAPFREAEAYIKYNLTNIQLGEFTNTVTNYVLPPVAGKTIYDLQPKFVFFTKIEFKYLVTLRAKLVKYSGEVSRNGIRLIIGGGLYVDTLQTPTLQLLPNWKAGAYSGNTAGIEPVINYSLSTLFVSAYANQSPYGYEGTEDIFIQFLVSYSLEQLQEPTDIISIDEGRLEAGLFRATAAGQGDWDIDVTISKYDNDNIVTLTHDERIYANGLISGTDLMGSLKPADVMKYAMRLTGSYLVETETTLTLVPFANYESNTPTNWSGKANLVNGITVDYLNNNLGENNYLKYKEDDTNTPLDPYYLAGNLPTNIGTVDNILYESVFAQSAFNQTFKGAVSLVRVPYYDAPLAYVYKVWINDATAYTVGQFVGYLGRLFKVLTNCLGSDGSPIVNTADYEEVDYSVFNNQSPEYRAIEVLTDQVTGVQVYGGTGTLLYTNSITAGLDGIDLQQSVNDTYGFIPSTFLDFRQIEVELMLTSIDIANLDLKKLVRIDELNGTFYVNALSNYTPDVSVPTKAILTLIP